MSQSQSERQGLQTKIHYGLLKTLNISNSFLNASHQHENQVHSQSKNICLTSNLCIHDSKSLQPDQNLSISQKSQVYQTLWQKTNQMMDLLLELQLKENPDGQQVQRNSFSELMIPEFQFDPFSNFNSNFPSYFNESIYAPIFEESPTELKRDQLKEFQAGSN